MKKNALSKALLASIGGIAGIAGIANAVNLNPDGLGEVLIYPYYTVNGGNNTLLSVVNTTDTVKAVKVRFLEGRNSQEVLDFNLYLSPFDVWTGAVLDPQGDDAGPGALITRDQSCTVPNIVGNPSLPQLGDGTRYVPFRTFGFADENPALGPNIDVSEERTREGHFEMIEMGVVEEDLDAIATGLEAAAIHGADGIPANCTALDLAWIPGSAGDFWVDDPNTDVEAPQGGLFGGASVFNVLAGTEASYNADAIAAFFDPVDNRTTLHTDPGSEFPSLNEANTGDGLTVESIVFDNGRVVVSDWDAANPVDAVSATYMHNNIFNEYATEANTNGTTEWVVTLPTKRFYVNGVAPRDPFTVLFNDDDVATGGACEPFGFEFWDREEQQPAVPLGGNDFSPPPPGVAPNIPVLCFEAQVITVNQDLASGISATLGSVNAANIQTDFESGWINFDFTQNVDVPGGDHTLTSTDNNVYTGLPVTGFAVRTSANGTLVDASGTAVLSNYAGLYQHRASRSITGN